MGVEPQTGCLFIYLGFYVAFNTVQVISWWVVGKAKETSTYSWSRFCTVNYQPMASNYQLSHLRPFREPEPHPQRWEVRVLPLCHRGPPHRDVRLEKIEHQAGKTKVKGFDGKTCTCFYPTVRVVMDTINPTVLYLSVLLICYINISIKITDFFLLKLIHKSMTYIIFTISTS